MANRRMLKKSLSYSLEFNSLSDYEKVIYMLVIPHLDDFGRISNEPRVLKAMVLPLDTKDSETLASAVSNIEKVGLIKTYEINGEKVLVYPTFDEDQTGLSKRTKSKLPDPPECTVVNFSEIPRDTQPTEPNITEQKGTEVNRSELNEDISHFPYKKVHTKFDQMSVVNPNTFNPMNDAENAALEAWRVLEPANPMAFTTTYYKAYKRGLPTGKFFEFQSEIRQDPRIKNKGAVFNKKVEEYFEGQ